MRMCKTGNAYKCSIKLLLVIFEDRLWVNRQRCSILTAQISTMPNEAKLSFAIGDKYQGGEKDDKSGKKPKEKWKHLKSIEFRYYSEALEKYEVISISEIEKITGTTLEKFEAFKITPYKLTEDGIWSSSGHKILSYT